MISMTSTLEQLLLNSDFAHAFSKMQSNSLAGRTTSQAEEIEKAGQTFLKAYVRLNQLCIRTGIPVK